MSYDLALYKLVPPVILGGHVVVERSLGVVPVCVRVCVFACVSTHIEGKVDLVSFTVVRSSKTTDLS